MPDVSLSDNPRTGGVIVCDAACRVALLPHGETKRAHPFRLAHHTAQIVRRASTVASLAINNLQAPDASVATSRSSVPIHKTCTAACTGRPAPSLSRRETECHQGVRRL